MDSFAALLAPLLALLALLLAGLTLRAVRGLQRRLFLLLLAASLLPSMAVLAVAVHQTQRSMEVLDAPGLQSSLDGALRLARATLAAEGGRLTAVADSILTAAAVGGEARSPSSQAAGARPLSWLLVRGEGATDQQHGPIEAGWLLARLSDAEADAVVRRRHRERETLVVVRAREGFTVVVARALPAVVAQDLSGIQAGSRGLAQLRLFYGELLWVRTLLVAATTMLLVLLVSMVASRALARRLAEPVSDLVEGTRRVASGDLEFRVETHAVDELAELVAAFNTMTADLADSRAQLRRSERISAWQGIARRLAHEIKNPLTPIHLALHRLRRRSEDPQVREGLDTILQETQNLQRLADEFSLLARLPEPRRRAVDPRPVAEQVCQLYVPPTVELQWEGWEALPAIDADEGQFRQVLGNLVKNAVEAMGAGGCLLLGARSQEHVVVLDVIDDGPGLPEPVDQIFEPDFSTKSSGTGLGLAIVRRIVEDHGGRIEAARRAPRGSCLRLIWPRRDVISPSTAGSESP